MGKPTVVGANWPPHSSMSFAHFWWSSRPLAEIPMTFTLRCAKSGALRIRDQRYLDRCAHTETYRRATSASSVVQTGVKSPGWEKRMACGKERATMSDLRKRRRRHAHPRIANPLMELDRALSRLGLEVRCNVSETKGGHAGSAGG